MKTYRVTPLVKPPAAFFSCEPPRLDYHLQVHGKSAAVVTRCSTERAWNNAPLLLPRATWGEMKTPDFTGEKKSYVFLAGEGVERFVGVWGKGKVAVQLAVSFLVPEIETSWKLRTVFAIKVLSPALVKAVILRSLEDYSDYRFTSSSGCLRMFHVCHFHCWRESTWLWLVMTIMISLMSSCVLIICF